MNFKKRLMMTLIISLAMIAILAAAIVFIGIDIESRSQKAGLLRAELNFRTRAIESIAELRNDYEKTKPYAEAVKNILPTQDQLVIFSRDFNLIANQNRVALNLSLRGGGQPGAKAPTLQQNDFAMTTQGTLDNLINFLKAIKTSRYFTKINSFDLSRQGGDSFSIILNGQVFSL